MQLGHYFPGMKNRSPLGLLVEVVDPNARVNDTGTGLCEFEAAMNASSYAFGPSFITEVMGYCSATAQKMDPIASSFLSNDQRLAVIRCVCVL
jgi:hypothetical protein